MSQEKKKLITKTVCCFYIDILHNIGTVASLAAGATL